MATADELLASVNEADRTLVIDGDLRTIFIPPDIKVLGVESDDEIERMYFKMPREHRGIDLSNFKIRINYLNGNNEGDVYDVDDASPESDGTITFSWLVGRHAASVKGTVTFNVCLKEVNSEGVVTREFNTTVATLQILQGLECTEQVLQEYNDILEQWRSKLFGISGTEEAKLLEVSKEQQQAISDKGDEVLDEIESREQEALNKGVEVLSDIELKRQEALATIPDDYATVYNMAEEAQRTKADAITLDAEGSSIFVDDASDNPLQNLKVYGRTTQFTTTGINLLDVRENLTWTGVYSKDVHIPAGTYILSWASATWGGDNAPYVRFTTNDKWMQISATNGTATLVLVKDENHLYIYTNGSSAVNSEGVSATINQLMVSVQGGVYEPYTGGKTSPNPDYPQEIVSIENPTVRIFGKNLIKHETTTHTSCGVTFILNTDKSVTVNGTSTDNALMNMTTAYKLPDQFVPGVEYIASGMTEQITLQVYEHNSETGAWVYRGSGISEYKFTLSDTAAGILIRLAVRPNITIDNVTIYPMIRLASDSDDTYEPYVESQSIIIPRTLPGLPVESGGNYTDRDGQQWIGDEIDFDRGMYIQRIGEVVFDETKNYHLNAYRLSNGDYVFGCTAEGMSISDMPVMADKLTHKVWHDWVMGVDGDLICYTGYAFYFYLRDTTIQTSDAFKEWVSNNPITVKYVLATPIETPLTSEEILAYKALKTNYPNTSILNDSDVYMTVEYSADTEIFMRDNQPGPTNEQIMQAVRECLAENGVQVPSDEYIQSFITSKLEEVENGSY